MFHVIFKHSKMLFLWGVIVAIVAGGITFLFPMYYSAVSQVLIISRDRAGVDPYTQSKAAERIGENLAEVMKTGDFYGKVLSSGVTFNRDRWKKLTERKQRKEWVKDVRPEVVYSTSLLNITVYGQGKEDAVSLANAVTQTLVGHGWEYVGGDIALKEVSSPLLSRWPTRPNVAMNVVSGFAVGVLVAALWVVRYKRHLFGN